MENTLSTKQKALRLNLDRSIYGTFAEIGAGQEVARYFFKAGGASGTVAKSISAYDMVFSDEIYGRETSGRYVCESRLKKMLDHEYDLLVERLGPTIGKDTTFFALANTVATSSFVRAGTEGHGWMGIRFQVNPGERCNDIYFHITLLDNQASFQQEALGICGVNLVFGSFFYYKQPEELLTALTDNLGQGRISIDMIRFSGPAFEHVDNRILNLDLVKRGYCDAIMFNENGQVVLPRDQLYKKNIMVVRGSFRPPTKVNTDIMQTGYQAFQKNIGKKEEITQIAEITINNLNNVGFNNEDFLARVDLTCSLGSKVLISNFPQFYKLSNYFSKLKAKNIALVLGGVNFKQIFDPDYNEADGGIFVALGQLFRDTLKVYVYPYKDTENGEQIDIFNLKVPDELFHLYQHLIHTKRLLPIENSDENILHIYSRKVLSMIQKGEPGWEEMVPETVAELIKKNKFFGCKS